MNIYDMSLWLCKANCAYIYSLDIAAAIIGDAANANVASSVYHLVGCVP